MNDCQWCYMYQKDPTYLISEGNGKYIELTFQYCPICGNQLKKATESYYNSKQVQQMSID